jgi:competence protein ComEA
MKKVNYLLLSGLLLSSCAFMPAQAATEAMAKKTMTQAVVTKLDINKANAEQLSALPGVGIKKAGEIIKYRELNGNFKSIDELVNVKGIGMKMIAKMIDLVKV